MKRLDLKPKESDRTNGTGLLLRIDPGAVLNPLIEGDRAGGVTVELLLETVFDGSGDDMGVTSAAAESNCESTFCLTRCDIAIWIVPPSSNDEIVFSLCSIG